jgi:signal transduction histidine kinase
MLAGFLALVPLLVVTVLILVDVLRTPDELPQEHAEWQAHETERAITAAPRESGAKGLPLEPAGTGIAAGAHDVGRGWRPDGVSPSAGGHRRPGTWTAAQQKGPRGALKHWPVHFRLFLLAIIPAVAAAAVTLSVVRIFSSLSGTAVHSQVSSVHDGAIVSALVAGAVLIVVLAVAVWFTIVVSRSVLKPLYRLRSGAVEVAEVRLPESIRRIGESDGEDAPPDVESIGVDSSDEIGDVAHAFDQVHREVLRLATGEAALRGKLNAIFTNVSRRSQALVERQIRLIDELEQGEQQADRRANLSKLDHLVTRMRRYSQNLLILAGHEPTSQPSQSMALINVIKAAVSEVEEYERVALNVQPGIAVTGLAVNDVVHLLAELVENATSLSAANTPVLISGRMLASGGLLVDITDRGFGMGAEEMAHANWRLDNPPMTDVTVVKSMGLSVVGRLAAKHGIRIRLRQAESGGLTALVWLPNALLLQQETPVSPGFTAVGSGRPLPDLTQSAMPSRRHQLNPDRAPAE